MKYRQKKHGWSSLDFGQLTVKVISNSQTSSWSTTEKSSEKIPGISQGGYCYPHDIDTNYPQSRPIFSSLTQKKSPTFRYWTKFSLHLHPSPPTPLPTNSNFHFESLSLQKCFLPSKLHCDQTDRPTLVQLQRLPGGCTGSRFWTTRRRL